MTLASDKIKKREKQGIKQTVLLVSKSLPRQLFTTIAMIMTYYFCISEICLVFAFFCLLEYLTIYLSMIISIYLWFYLSIYEYIYLSMNIYIYEYIYIYLWINLSICPCCPVIMVVFHLKVWKHKNMFSILKINWLINEKWPTLQ